VKVHIEDKYCFFRLIQTEIQMPNMDYTRLSVMENVLNRRVWAWNVN